MAHALFLGGGEDMKPANGNRPDVTHLKPCDHQLFFEALDRVRRSSGLPIDALRKATSLPQETTIVFFEEVAFPALWTLQYHHFQRIDGLAPREGRSEDAGSKDGNDLQRLPKVSAVYVPVCRRDQTLVLRTGA